MQGSQSFFLPKDYSSDIIVDSSIFFYQNKDLKYQYLFLDSYVQAVGNLQQMDVDLFSRHLDTSTLEISHSPYSSWNPLAAPPKNPLIPSLAYPLTPPLRQPLIPQMTLSGIICNVNISHKRCLSGFTKKVESCSNDRTDAVYNRILHQHFQYLSIYQEN